MPWQRSLCCGTPGAIDGQRIFVVGHSLGGMLVPRIADLDSGIAGFIIMAGATEPIEDMMLVQTSYVSMLDGVVTEGEQAVLDQLILQVDRVKALSDSSPATEFILGAPAPYWLDLRGYDPASAAADIDRPMLVLQGERDYQVTSDHLERWREALSSSDDVEFAVYPTLNHLFIAESYLFHLLAGWAPVRVEINKCRFAFFLSQS